MLRCRSLLILAVDGVIAQIDERTGGHRRATARQSHGLSEAPERMARSAAKQHHGLRCIRAQQGPRHRSQRGNQERAQRQALRQFVDSNARQKGEPADLPNPSC